MLGPAVGDKHARDVFVKPSAAPVNQSTGNFCCASGAGSAGKQYSGLAYSTKGVSPIRNALNFAALAAVLTASCSFAPSASAQQTVQQPVPQTTQQPSQQDQQLTGTITGSVFSKEGNPISGAEITLTRPGESTRQQAASDDSGNFSFSNIIPGTFKITVSAPAFADQTFSGILASGQTYIVPPITLVLATVNTTVVVEPTAVVAERQIKVEEQQRVLGVIPNFYVSYVPNAAPLNPRQKLQLSWRDAIDPVTFILIGATAGLQQATNQFAGYGQGAQGFGKRYGASYADFATGTIFGSVVFPAIFKQDPRYFYKGTGSTRSRIFYAIANAVICKGDNGHWQANYSSILGNLASGGISNLYYPSQDQRDAALTFEVTGIGIAATAADNILQEFLIPKLSPKFRKDEAAQHAPSGGR